MKKKLFVAALILILCSSAVFAAGRTEGSSSPTLIWWVIGSQGSYLPDGLRVISDYIEPQIGAKLEIKVAGWGEAGTRFQTILNSGEYYDLMFTDVGRYNNDVAIGAYADITDRIRTDAPRLQTFIPGALWDGVRINGRIYAIPTYKDSSKTEFQVWDDAMVRKYNINTSRVLTFPELDQVFRQMKAGEGARFYPLILSQGSTFGNGIFNNEFDNLLTGLPAIGVGLFDQNRKVVSVYEQPQVMERLHYLHRWYNDGIVNPDAPVVQETQPYRPFGIAQGWPAAATGWALNQGVDKVIAVRGWGPYYSTETIQGSLTAISRNSRNITQSLKFLELANTDHKLRDMLAFGIEGTTFEYVKPNVIRDLAPGQWGLPAYQQATFFQMSTREGSPEDEWDQVRGQNESAVNTVLNGFVFDNRSIINELTNCKSIHDRYQNELLTGASNPDTAVRALMTDLYAAGFQRIIDEAQRQINAWNR